MKSYAHISRLETPPADSVTYFKNLYSNTYMDQRTIKQEYRKLAIGVLFAVTAGVSLGVVTSGDNLTRYFVSPTPTQQVGPVQQSVATYDIPGEKAALDKFVHQITAPAKPAKRATVVQSAINKK